MLKKFLYLRKSASWDVSLGDNIYILIPNILSQLTKILKITKNMKKEDFINMKSKEKQKLEKRWYTSREIAEWMEISYGYYRKNIKERLEYLTNFAKIEPRYGGVEIKEVYNPYYAKDLSEDDKYYLELVKESNCGLCSLSGMTRKAMRDGKMFKNLSESSIYYRLTKAGIRSFGVTAEKDSKGTYGTRCYIWAIKVNDYNYYRLMTKEETQLYSDLLDKYSNERKDAEKQLKLNRDAYKKGELTDKEFAELTVKSYDFFDSVIAEFKERTGCQIVRTTEHDLFENYAFWSIEE